MKLVFRNIKELNSHYQDLLLEWRNQDHVRKMMISQESITWEEHRAYIQRILDSLNYEVYIGFRNEEPFGVLNVWKIGEDNTFEYGYYLIREEDLNGGLGVLMEYFAIEHIFSFAGSPEIKLHTYAHNKKTIRLHQQFGYSQSKEEDGLCEQVLNLSSWTGKKESIRKLLRNFYDINCGGVGNE